MSSRLQQRQSVVKVIATLLKQHVGCHHGVVVAFNSTHSAIDYTEEEDMADELLLDALANHHRIPTAVFTKSVSSLNSDEIYQREPIRNHVVIVSHLATESIDVYQQLVSIYFVGIVVIVLVGGRPAELDDLLRKVRNENLVAILESTDHAIAARTWKVDDSVKNYHTLPNGSMKGRHIRVGVVHQPPAVIVKQKANSSDIVVTGIEPAMINSLSIQLGFTYEYVLSPPKELWGYVVDGAEGNHSSTGLVNMLISKQIDLAIGNFYVSAIRKPFIDYSVSYGVAYESFLVPAPRPYAKWKAVYLALNFENWIVTLATAIAVIIALRLFALPALSRPSSRDKTYADISFCVMYIIGNFASTPVRPLIVRSLANRVCLLWWLLGISTMSTLYRSQLTSHITLPFSPPAIKTLRQLADSPLNKVIQGSMAKNVLLKSPDASLQLLGGQMVVEKNLTRMFSLLGTGSWAVESNVDSLNYMAATMYPINNDGPQVQQINEYVLSNPVALGLQKDSPLKPYFDRRIMIMMEAGILKYERLSFRKRMPKLDVTNTKAHLMSFSLDSLLGAFIVLIFGTIAAMLVFTLELLIAPRKVLVI